MAALTTHLVIGERVYPQVEPLGASSSLYGAFLLGCLLPDVNAFSEIDRRETHFVGRIGQDGLTALTKSCTRFLACRGRILRRPWDSLSDEERAFVAGYLCHLAADEAWKSFGWRSLRKLGIAAVGQLRAPMGVPMGVLTTAGSVLSAELYLDFPAVALALQEACIPDVFNHVPYGAFVGMWDVLQPYALDGRTYGAYLKLLASRGRSKAEIEAAHREYEGHWEDAVALIHDMGGVEAAVLFCVERATGMLPRLWREV
jgi:hypothetical protein